MNPTAEPRVIIRHCGSYDPAAIRKIVREGLDELGLKPHGRTLVKPNLVMAGKMFPHAHTRPEFVEGVLRALQEAGGDGMTELAVGERCGITVPTRSVFAQSGWDAMLARVPGVKRYLLRGGAAGRDPATRTRGACATTSSRPSRSPRPTSS